VTEPGSGGENQDFVWGRSGAQLQEQTENDEQKDARPELFEIAEKWSWKRITHNTSRENE